MNHVIAKGIVAIAQLVAFAYFAVKATNHNTKGEYSQACYNLIWAAIFIL